MPDRTRVKDRSSLHKCRIELPNLIDDMGLSVYEFRLYAHLKRVAGDDGSCWKSTRTLATACNMSMGQVSKAKDELERRGLIVRETRAVRGGYADDIAIVDLWPQNFKAYAAEREASDESVQVVNAFEGNRSGGEHLKESVHTMNTSSESDHTVNAFVRKRSPGETKNHDSSSIENHDPPPPTMGGGGGGGDVQKTEKTATYHWLRENGVKSPKAAERNQHHDLAATQAFYRRMVGEAVGDERERRIKFFIAALDADGPPPVTTRPERTNGHLQPPPSPLAGLPSHAEAKQKFRETAAQLGLRGATERETHD